MDFNNIDAEHGLIGQILVDNKRFDDCQMKPEYFYYPAHSRLYAEISRRIESGEAATPVTLKDFADLDEDLKKQGGAKYLVQLFNEAPMLNTPQDYANEIVRQYTRRKVTEIVQAIHEEVKESKEDATSLLLKVEEILGGFDTSENKAQGMRACLNKAFDWMDSVKAGTDVSYKTGLQNIDKWIGGLKPGGLYVLAGRPGMGKTAIALNIAANLAAQRHVLFFSLEMPDTELTMRLLASRTGISVFKQMNTPLNDNDRGRLNAARDKVQSLKLIVDESAGVDIDYITAMSRRFNRKYPNGVIVIDHLGLIRGNNRLQKVHQIEEITTRLKSLSKQINAPVVLLSQLSRAVELRDDKKPMLSDLRDSGSIEQDADVVMFAYRPEYYAERNEVKRGEKDTDESYRKKKEKHDAYLESVKGKAFIFVEKNRQGLVGTAKLKFDGERQVFTDE